MHTYTFFDFSMYQFTSSDVISTLYLLANYMGKAASRGLGIWQKKNSGPENFIPD